MTQMKVKKQEHDSSERMLTKMTSSVVQNQTEQKIAGNFILFRLLVFSQKVLQMFLGSIINQ